MDDVSQKDFHHPYQPYNIQYDLMRAIYQCISEGKIGIFESPTGTGKSLSLICSSLTWLRDFQNAEVAQVKAEDEDPEEPSWVTQHYEESQKQAILQDRAAFEKKLTNVRLQRERQAKKKDIASRQPKRIKHDDQNGTEPDDDFQAYELDDYESDGHDDNTGPSKRSEPGLSSGNLELMQKLGLMHKSSDDDNLLFQDETKIFFCSRTHSQLSQFSQELRKVKLPPPPWQDFPSEEDVGARAHSALIKHLALGSRKNLCINSKVASLGNLQAINERCLELQRPDVAQEKRCQFLPKDATRHAVDQFRDEALSSIKDIEDLAEAGRALAICPYYASREAIKPSEIVTLPYPLLLQKSVREAINLSLKGHVVIIDEAHNLMDTIANLHSATVTFDQITKSRSGLITYLAKFRNRLKGKNRVYIAQLLRVLDSMASYLQQVSSRGRTGDGTLTVTDLMSGKGVDQVNLFKLTAYLQQSKLAHKIEGYLDAEHRRHTATSTAKERQIRAPTTPVLSVVHNFIMTLTNPAAEGRFFYERGETGDLQLKYLLLDPTHHFQQVVEEARAVILAGGTMSPMEDYVRHLFAYVAPERITTWSCGHIVPRENLIAFSLSQGTSQVNFNFAYDQRNSTGLMEELGQSLIQTISVVPDGVVVFFPSYAYMDQVVSCWQKSPKKLWLRLFEKKAIFQESKALSVDKILFDYSSSIAQSKGGLLLCVVNGKLSEGINFSDKLGRTIVVVGLPFPNSHTAQWRAKIEFIEKSTLRRTGSTSQAKEACREFYENVCMRAVNQSIGRAIRHRGDYACILLIDERYKSSRIEKKLPQWIRQGLVADKHDIPAALRRIEMFFKDKQSEGI